MRANLDGKTTNDSGKGRQGETSLVERGRGVHGRRNRDRKKLEWISRFSHRVAPGRATVRQLCVWSWIVHARERIWRPSARMQLAVSRTVLYLRFRSRDLQTENDEFDDWYLSLAVSYWLWVRYKPDRSEGRRGPSGNAITLVQHKRGGNSTVCSLYFRIRVYRLVYTLPFSFFTSALFRCPLSRREVIFYDSW